MTDMARPQEKDQTDMTVEQHFDDLYARTNRRTLIYLGSRAQQIDDVKDHFQEIYLEVFRSLNRSRGALELRNKTLS